MQSGPGMPGGVLGLLRVWRVLLAPLSWHVALPDIETR